MLANLCFALALRLFLVENGIAAGGFAGIATSINSIIKIPIGTIIMIMNIPLFIVSFKVKGVSFTLITISSTLVYSLAINILSPVPCIVDDPFIAAFLGGALYGLACFLVQKADASVGGSDLVSRLLLVKYKNMSLGKMYMIIDGLTVLVAIAMFHDLQAGLLSFIAIFTCSIVTDKLIEGSQDARICYIITLNNPCQMADVMMEKLQRSITYQPCSGMLSREDKSMLIAVVKKSEVYVVKDLVSKLDPKAFVFIAHASEVVGKGFGDVQSIEQRSALNERFKSE
jgi:uncharacterized membrane-anchored protein YitT (DUF2179 family)